MSWRIVTIQNPAKLSVKNKQILINRGEKDNFSIPIEDIVALILEDQQITLTHALLSILQKYNVVLITCDNKHLPNGILLSFHQHSRFSEVAHLQNTWSIPFKKKCWKFLIQQKIKNQAKCLEKANKPFKKLLSMAKNVDSGDTKNVESVAARYYWKNLFNYNFIRNEESFTNSSLNYGYAIVRAIIGRSLAGAGLLPCFGINHNNSLNAFNLADDILEPFRPIVDFHVWKMLNSLTTPSLNLTKQMRENLLGIIIQKCLINNESHTLHNAAEISCLSLVSSLRKKDPLILKLPSLYYE